MSSPLDFIPTYLTKDQHSTLLDIIIVTLADDLSFTEGVFPDSKYKSTIVIFILKEPSLDRDDSASYRAIIITISLGYLSVCFDTFQSRVTCAFLTTSVLPSRHRDVTTQQKLLSALQICILLLARAASRCRRAYILLLWFFFLTFFFLFSTPNV